MALAVMSPAAARTEVPGKDFRETRPAQGNPRIRRGYSARGPGTAVALRPLSMTESVSRSIRVAAVGDLHCTKTSEGAFQPLLAKVAERADVLVLCGDLTDYGTVDEARVLARELAATKLPKLAVLGNHDFESSTPEEVVRILTETAGVTVLDGTAIELLGVGFAGVKGFPGGFGARALQSWGEAPIKAFVHAALEESLKLESALARLRTPGRVALLHYSPIAGTVENEPVEIYPFLGSSRLEEPLNRYAPSVVFHGHAHRGRPEGATSAGVPVYNVALPLLRRSFPDQAPFRVVEVPVAEPAGTGAALASPQSAPTRPAAAVAP
jgi:Icc-related predicted phosphoesterase